MIALAALWTAIAVARVETTEAVVAFTFDACATSKQANGFDRAVFDILHAEKIPATVFVSGRWLEFHPAEARELAADPLLEIGNHGYSHPQLTKLSSSRVASQILRTEALIERLGKHSVAFRPPAGVWDQRVLRVVSRRHLPTVLWDVVSGDAGGHVSSRKMVAAVTRNVRPGSIVIFHINGRGPRTRYALPEIIRQLRERGFRFVQVSELLNLPGARMVPARPQIEYRSKRAHKAG